MATAELRGDRYVAHAPRTVGVNGGLLERMYLDDVPVPTLLGFHFPIGVPRAYAEEVGIENFANRPFFFQRTS